MREDYMGTIKDTIFVFANAIEKIRDLATSYDIVVVGTNDTNPDILANEVASANDVRCYFFIISNKEELDAVNNVFARIQRASDEDEGKIFVLTHKKYFNKVNFGQLGGYIREFSDLDEQLIIDLVLNTTVENQEQYYLERKPIATPIMTGNQMEVISHLLDTQRNKNILETIKASFSEIKRRQDNLSITSILDNTDKSINSKSTITLETQEYMRQVEKDLKERLKTATDKEDVKEIVTTLLEVFNMRSDDLRDTSEKLISKIIQVSQEDLDKAKQKIEDTMVEIEKLYMENDLQQIDILMRKRDEFIAEVEKAEKIVFQRADALCSMANTYLTDLKQSSLEVLTENKELIDKKLLIEYQEKYKNNSLEISKKSTELAGVTTRVINDLKNIVVKYKQIVNMDTTIMESQKRVNETLITQKVTEKVEYKSELSSKIYLLVSPTPNLGASTIMNMFTYHWERILLLDFRELSSRTSRFKEITYEEFMTLPLTSFSDTPYVKVTNSLATSVDEGIVKRLDVLLPGFDVIFILVDKFMTIGLPTDTIQRMIYLSDTSDRNLLEINQISSIYEELFELKRVMFILNKTTTKIKNNLDEKLIIAGIDPTKVRINCIPLKAELADEDEECYKLLGRSFNYF